MIYDCKLDNYEKLRFRMFLLASLCPAKSRLNSWLDENPQSEIIDCIGSSALSGLVNSSQKCWKRYISLRVSKPIV